MAETTCEKHIREAKEKDPKGFARAQARLEKEQARYRRVKVHMSLSSGKARVGLGASLRGTRANQLLENMHELIVEHFKRDKDEGDYTVRVEIVQKGGWI